MQTPVWRLNKRWRYEGLRLNSSARSRMVKVVPDSTMRRIFPTRPSSMVDVNERSGAAAAFGMPPLVVMVSASLLLAKLLLAELTREFRVRTGSSCGGRVVRYLRLNWFEPASVRAFCKVPKPWTVGVDRPGLKGFRWQSWSFGRPRQALCLRVDTRRV